MRARLTVLVVAILLVAGFAALNWTEFARPVPLSFGAGIVDAPLGLLMLGLLIFTLLAALAGSAIMDARYAVESRRFAKELAAQRELADRAEASRFTELRHHIDTQIREMRQRESATLGALETMFDRNQKNLELRLREIDSSVAAHVGQLEDRLERRQATERTGVTV